MQINHDFMSLFDQILRSPEVITIADLPRISLEDRSLLPSKSGIYFAIDCYDQIQYIGRSRNIAQRWANHHRYPELADIGGIDIAYLLIDGCDRLHEIEKRLIDWHKPVLNRSECIQPNVIQMSIPSELLAQAEEIVKREGWRMNDLYRIFWERGFADYAGEVNERLLGEQE